MKKLLLLLLICFPIMGMAKDEKNNSDPKYLTGAITYDDGKVTFTKEFKLPGVSQNDIYTRVLAWAEKRYQPEGKLHSFVSYKNEAEGQIAVSGEEYLVFSSTALSLDRTRIYYQLTTDIEDGLCKMKMTRIRYWYDENRDGGEKYTAEEWISDEMALNKKKTKLAPICGKFRRETIDLKDEIFQEIANELGVNSLANTMNTTSNPKQIQTSVVAPVVPSANATSTTIQTTVPANSGQTKEIKEVTLNTLPSNLNEIATNGKVTLTANGEELEIKAANWGGFGKMFSKDIAYILLDKSRIAASAMMEQSYEYTIAFYTTNTTTPIVVVECKKMMTQKMSAEDLKALNLQADTNKEYTLYIGEVIKTSMR